MTKIIDNFLSRTDLSAADSKTFFIYDMDKIGENVKILKSLFPVMDKIYFSVKANPSKELLKKLNELGVCFDVSSPVEMATAFSACADHGKITISGPAKTDKFINQISKLKVRSVHIDSLEEYELLKNTDVNLSVRWPLENAYSQKVGLPKADLLSIIKDASKSRRLSGIHIYIGRERAQNDIVIRILREIKEFVQQHANSFIDKINLYWGGGLPLVNHVKSDFFPSDSFFNTHLECGRALVHNAGYYVTQVLEVKVKADEKLIIVNGGLQHLATHFGSPRFGQDDVTISFPKSNGSEFTPTNIYGSLGTTTDLLIKNINVPKNIRRGDWVAIGPAGGYGYSAGTNQFLGPHSVQEVFIQGQQITILDSPMLNYLEAGLYEAQNS